MPHRICRVSVAGLADGVEAAARGAGRPYPPNPSTNGAAPTVAPCRTSHPRRRRRPCSRAVSRQSRVVDLARGLRESRATRVDCVYRHGALRPRRRRSLLSLLPLGSHLAPHRRTDATRRMVASVDGCRAACSPFVQPSCLLPPNTGTSVLSPRPRACLKHRTAWGVPQPADGRFACRVLGASSHATSAARRGGCFPACLPQPTCPSERSLKEVVLYSRGQVVRAWRDRERIRRNRQPIAPPELHRRLGPTPGRR